MATTTEPAKVQHHTIQALAMIHGRHWYVPGQGGEPGIEALIVNEAILSRTIHSALPEFFDAMGDQLPDDRKLLINRAFDRFPDLKADRLKDGRPTTVVHGDPHAWNVMFPRQQSSPASCIFIDWEDWRFDAGAADLAHMMALNWHPDRRARHELSFLHLYHDALMSHIDAGYSRDDLALDYRIGLLQHVVVPVYLHRFRPADSIWLEHLERWFAAVDDLGCRDLL